MTILGLARAGRSACRREAPAPVDVDVDAEAHVAAVGLASR